MKMGLIFSHTIFLVLLDECYIFYLSFNECGRNYTEGNGFLGEIYLVKGVLGTKKHVFD